MSIEELGERLAACPICRAACKTCDGAGRAVIDGWDRDCVTCSGSGFAATAKGHTCPACDETRRNIRIERGLSLCDECGHQCTGECTNCAGLKNGESICSICARSLT